MSRGTIQVALVAGLALAWLTPCEAQIPGNIDYPVFASAGSASFNGEYTRGLNDDAGKDNYVGARVVIPLSKVSVQAGGGLLTCSGCGLSTRGGAGIGVAVHLLDDPDAPLALSAQAGVGFTKVSGSSVFGVPVGLALGFKASDTVRPWVVPMFILQRGNSQTEAGFAAALGADVTFASGFGFHVGFELTAIAGDVPLAAGAGLHYQLP
jgi:hypothetical protein